MGWSQPLTIIPLETLEQDNEMRLNQMSDIIDSLAPPYVMGKK